MEEINIEITDEWAELIAFLNEAIDPLGVLGLDVVEGCEDE